MDPESPRVVAATEHKCYGVGTLKEVVEERSSSIKAIEVGNISGGKLGLEPVDIAVQHMENGRTRPICDYLESTGCCLKLQEATRQICLMALNKGVEAGRGPVTEYTHQTHVCKWKALPISRG
ncbi:MAG: hypothetical protein US89_C0006G0076 [Candidatus Peregrinibacteria bacterium GW2011_GWF2_38_29]|nr:MAG: hypothetical protein US89_C0006G0076 [Candidatus Peregrinibacteria bacterium GW2011_GWF2_38_29]HBB03267.1 hypothetical protein [Candidatus Peregrinibacteria bacterium]